MRRYGQSDLFVIKGSCCILFARDFPSIQTFFLRVISKIFFAHSTYSYFVQIHNRLELFQYILAIENITVVAILQDFCSDLCIELCFFTMSKSPTVRRKTYFQH